jgi:hypothetical protein
MIDAITRDANLRGDGIGLTIIEWASAVLNNGMGNYEKAVAAVERATEGLVGVRRAGWCRRRVGCGARGARRGLAPGL